VEEQVEMKATLEQLMGENRKLKQEARQRANKDAFKSPDLLAMGGGKRKKKKKFGQEVEMGDMAKLPGMSDKTQNQSSNSNDDQPRGQQVKRLSLSSSYDDTGYSTPPHQNQITSNPLLSMASNPQEKKKKKKEEEVHFTNRDSLI